MKIENLQELEKLIKWMRKAGVDSIKTLDIELKLSNDLPAPSAYKRRKARSTGEPEPAIQGGGIGATAGFSDGDILFWSSTPPGAEPAKDS